MTELETLELGCKAVLSGYIDFSVHGHEVLRIKILDENLLSATEVICEGCGDYTPNKETIVNIYTKNIPVVIEWLEKALEVAHGKAEG